MKKIIKIKINDIINQIGVFDSEDERGQEEGIFNFYKGYKNLNEHLTKEEENEIKLSNDYLDFRKSLTVEEVENWD